MSDFLEGLDSGDKMARPTATATANADMVGIHLRLWYASFSATLTIDEARMLAVHLANAANEAEANK